MRSVDVSGMKNLRMFYVFGGCPELTSVNLGRAVNLQFLGWPDEFGGGEYPDICTMESLEVLGLGHGETKTPRDLHGRLDFCRSSNLEFLGLSSLPLNLLNLNQAVQLRELVVRDCQHLERFDGLEALVKLEDIMLGHCSSLLELPSLVNFPCLKAFALTGAAKLREIQGFSSLTGLQQLMLEVGEELEELPRIEACTRLTLLILSSTSIGDCSWISMMKDLTLICLSGTKIRSVPDCSGLIKLCELWLVNCPALESLGNSLGIPKRFPKAYRCSVRRIVEG
ncbi:hypothetical protein M758_UG189900 [Ceratodon purpureus]|nr:hypothetical protein M758_UG189900 [Ceratodon purpureus]